MNNQYDEKQIAFEIDGYYSITPCDPKRRTTEGAFDAAKNELLAALERKLALVRSFEFATFKRLSELPQLN